MAIHHLRQQYNYQLCENLNRYRRVYAKMVAELYAKTIYEYS